MQLTPQPGKAAMHRIKHPPLRNKIDLANPAQLRAWTRRLGISADTLRSVVDKAGNSVAAVTKEVGLQRACHQVSPAPNQLRCDATGSPPAQPGASQAPS
jgi:hypothetical protein